MKLVAGHQPNLYPYGGFFAKMLSVDHFVIVDTVQYVKKEYHNRNRIKLCDGTAHWITIPVKNAGRYKQLICDVEIDNRQNWRREHLRTFQFHYRKSPHFEEVISLLEDKLLSKDYLKLVEYNFAFIQLVKEYLGIPTPLFLASRIGVKGPACELIANLCFATGSNSYLHGIHGLDYVDFAYLESKGIESFIQIYEQVSYPQLHGAFIPNLSVIDILFNCGRDALAIIKNSNKILTKAEAIRYREGKKIDGGK